MEESINDNFFKYYHIINTPALNKSQDNEAKKRTEII